MKYTNSKFLSKNKVNEFGEIILDSTIPGVTSEDEKYGILVHHIPSNKVFGNLLRASEETQTNVGLILLALKNRGAVRKDFEVFLNDMTHAFTYGVSEMSRYSKTFDARLIDRNDLGVETAQFLTEFLEQMDEANKTPEEIMTNSPLVYINKDGEERRFNSVHEVATLYHINHLDVLKALNGNSPLTDRFKWL